MQKTLFFNLANTVIDELEAAKVFVKIAMAYFTNDKIIDKIIEIAKKGIDIEIVIDYEAFKKKNNLSQENIDTLVENGATIYIACQNAGGASEPQMHHKFCIIDGIKVLTGSFNWTTKGDKKNKENLNIITDRKVAEKYHAEFSRLRAEVINDDQPNGYFGAPVFPKYPTAHANQNTIIQWDENRNISISNHSSSLNISKKDNSLSFIVKTSSIFRFYFLVDGKKYAKNIGIAVLLMPQISFDIDGESTKTIRKGQQVILSWSVQHAAQIFIEIDNHKEVVTANSKRTHYPEKNTTYQLSAISYLGITEYQKVFVRVLSFPVPEVLSIAIPVIPIPVKVTIERSVFSTPRGSNILSELNLPPSNLKMPKISEIIQLIDPKKSMPNIRTDAQDLHNHLQQSKLDIQALLDSKSKLYSRMEKLKQVLSDENTDNNSQT
jgi:hypothetical protein